MYLMNFDIGILNQKRYEVLKSWLVERKAICANFMSVNILRSKNLFRNEENDVR